MTKRPSRLAVAVLAAVVAVGLPAAASAAPGGKGPKPAPTKVVKVTKVTKVTKADRQLAAARRQVLSVVSTKDAALVRAARTVSRSSLAVGEPEVLVNIAADRATLTQLRAAASAATTVTAVRLVGADARSLRPEVYSVVVSGLRQAVHIQDVAAARGPVITDLAAQADAKELEGYDVAAVRDLLASATLAAEEAATLARVAIDRGLLLTATSSQADRDAFTGDLEAAGALLETVEAQLVEARDALAAMVPATVEPVTEPTA